jgi:alanine or glycine:cation symporter, AGCS family
MSWMGLFARMNEYITFFCVFPAIVLVGFFLTMKLQWLQCSKLKMSLYTLLQSKRTKEEEETGGITHYQAVSAVLAGNLGTGNISGMAIALTVGGPGSLVWMWIMAFFGSMIQYSSCLLGAKYRHKNAEGKYVGGPMYYLEKGLGFKKTAVCFSVFAIIAAFAVGNFAQVNSIVLPLESIGINPLLCSIAIAICSAFVLLGGIERMARVAASIVPLMALLYLGAGSVVLFFYQEQIMPSIHLMIKSAFQGDAFLGGMVGITVMKALSTGFERGLFATDAGTGIVPILQSGARTKDPVTTGIAALVAPLCVMVICSMTGLILMVTGAFTEVGLQSTNMVVFAFQKVFGDVSGLLIVVLALALFAYTTILAWGGCLERAAEFLWDKKKAKVFLYLFLALIPAGAVAQVRFVWVFADIAISCMLITNLIGVVCLSKEVIADSRCFFRRQFVK